MRNLLMMCVALPFIILAIGCEGSKSPDGPDVPPTADVITTDIDEEPGPDTIGPGPDGNDQTPDHSTGDDTTEGPDSDIGGDDGPGTPPDPKAVFELRTRSNFLSDGPYTVDRVKMVRQVQVMPDLDVRVLASHDGGLWIGTASLLFLLDQTTDVIAVIPFDEPDLPIADIHPGSQDQVLVARGADLWAVTSNGNRTLLGSHDQDIQKIVTCGDAIYVLADGKILTMADGAFTPMTDAPQGTVDAF